MRSLNAPYSEQRASSHAFLQPSSLSDCTGRFHMEATYFYLKLELFRRRWNHTNEYCSPGIVEFHVRDFKWIWVNIQHYCSVTQSNYVNLPNLNCCSPKLNIQIGARCSWHISSLAPCQPSTPKVRHITRIPRPWRQRWRRLNNFQNPTSAPNHWAADWTSSWRTPRLWPRQIHDRLSSGPDCLRRGCKSTHCMKTFGIIMSW